MKADPDWPQERVPGGEWAAMFSVTPAGKLVTYWGQDGLFKNPHTVRKFSLDGKVLMTIGTPNQPGADQTHLNQPNDVAVAANGDIYVSDGYGNDRIIVFDKHGQYVRAWGKLGTGPGEFSQPHSLVLDSRGRVYVADRNNVRIQVFDSQGKYLTEWKNIVTPWALEMTSDDVRDSRQPGGAGHASQGSALHEAGYRRAAEAALGNSKRR